MKHQRAIYAGVGAMFLGILLLRFAMGLLWLSPFVGTLAMLAWVAVWLGAISALGRHGREL